MKAATIYDVARLAGVSHQTVSRFLSGFKGIRPETRERVESALAELDYRPNSAARQLRTQRSNRIAVLADRVDLTGPARIVAGATAASRERGYLLDVIVTNGIELPAIESALALAREHRVVGILATAQTDAVVEYLYAHASGIPVVVDARLSAFSEGPSMNEFTGALAADHLMDLGHDRVGYLSGPSGWVAATGRMRGFLDRIAQRGGEVVWTREGDWSADSGAAAWLSLPKGDRRATAIAAGNDSMAIGLISAASGDGVSVPDDLSVIGNDDIHEARYLLPPLTTVAVDFESEGRMLVEHLLLRIEPDSSATTQAVRPHLVARGSTRRR
jgi:DNA-binding LacI/PurR family transcriptional regulator